VIDLIAGLALSALLADALPVPATAAGKLAYEQHCSSCHGADLRGGLNAPSLRGVGAADLDFWMVTGRMPAAVPWVEVGHRGPQISPGEIAAIEAYVTAIAPGGPPIPDVATGGDLTHGRALFQENCEHCHGVGAAGASIGDLAWAPTLHLASITQVAEAIRVGPDNMPKFAPSQLDPRALGDLATYVMSLDRTADTPTFPMRSSGPVPEGLYGWLTVGLLALAAYAFSKPRMSSPAENRARIVARRREPPGGRNQRHLKEEQPE
jgi:ubiquinol-cytochrome c reductase cytochrome c subunit